MQLVQLYNVTTAAESETKNKDAFGNWNDTQTGTTTTATKRGVGKLERRILDVIGKGLSF